MLLSHFDDIAARAAKIGMTASKFLTPAEKEELIRQSSHWRDVNLVFDGGYEAAERCVAIFLAENWGGYEQSELFTAFRVQYRPEDVITHRDILGSLMALGIEREVIGDIIANGSPAYFVCLSTLADYIKTSITKIGRVGVTLTKVSPSELPVIEEHLELKTVTVASIRLDAIVSEGFSISRGTAAELIQAGLVSVDHTPCEKPDRKLEAGSVISVKGKGKVKITALGGESRKGRTFVELGRYV